MECVGRFERPFLFSDLALSLNVLVCLLHPDIDNMFFLAIIDGWDQPRSVACITKSYEDRPPHFVGSLVTCCLAIMNRNSTKSCLAKKPFDHESVKVVPCLAGSVGPLFAAPRLLGRAPSADGSRAWWPGGFGSQVGQGLLATRTDPEEATADFL